MATGRCYEIQRMSLAGMAAATLLHPTINKLKFIYFINKNN